MPELGEGITTYIIIAAVGFGLWLAINWFRRRQFQTASTELEPAVTSRGWTMQSEQKGGSQTLLIEGRTDGIAWKIETLNRRGSGADNDYGESHSTWHTESASLPGELILIFGSNVRSAQAVFRKQILPGLVKNVLDNDKADMELFKSAQEAKSGSSSLRKRYMLMTTNDGAVGRLLDNGAEMALAAWPGKPTLSVAAVSAHGVRIKLVGVTANIDQVAGLVELGVGLAKAVGK